jgi:predicted metal-dependent peptidase
MDKETEAFLEKITTARRYLLKDYPEFGMTSLSLRIVIDPTCPAAWTDGVSIGFNPKWVADTSMEILTSLWAHECLHVMLLHPFREEGRDHERWNIAGDYVINSMIKSTGLPIGKGWLYTYMYSDKTTEEVYDLLPDTPPNMGDSKGSKTKQGGKHCPHDGAGVTDGIYIGEVRPAPGDRESIKRMETAQKIRNIVSIQTAKTWGNLPGEILRQIGALSDSPAAGWRDILRQHMDTLAREDYSWRKLDPQYMERELLVPTLWSENMSELVIIADSSGSISDENIKQFNVEFNSCLLELPSTTVYFMSCDTKIQTFKEYHSKDGFIKLEIKGGGGTNFIPPFQKVEEMGLNPVLLIYLTDLECGNFPSVPPDYPVLWVDIRGSRHAHKPPFGEVINISK